jgi:penicillin amidase
MVPAMAFRLPRFRTWLIALSAIIVGIPALAAGAAGIYVYLSLPKTSGTINLASPREPVEIIRDARGVPHIFAAHELDAWYALGFVHAQDRLVQMEVMRRAARGRLSEVMGRATLNLDRMMRGFDLAGGAARSLQVVSSESRAVLEAYAAGVNAHLATHAGPLPPEFLLAGPPESWTAEDSLLWAQLMGFQLTGNWRQELTRARVLGRLTREQAAEYWNEWPSDAATTLAALDGLDAGLDLRRIADALPQIGPQSASNEWVIAGSRSVTGRPFLVNDPHLGLNAPGTWYLARIVLPDRTYVGATAPGTPGLILGHNGRIAWGFTTTMGDATDLFIEEVDPSDPTRYRTGESWEPFTVRREVIRVRGEPDQVLTLRATRNGLVISDLIRGFAEQANQRVLALARAQLAGPDRTADAMFKLNQARNWEEFLAAIALWQAPVQNVVYADGAGNIGFAVVGAIPRRRAGDGWLPLPGWIDANRWNGLVPAEAMPRRLNPPSGRIANANNRVTTPDSAVFIARDWDAPYRNRRIIELLDARARHDRSTMEAILTDPLSVFAREMLPALRRIPAEDQRARQALGLLLAWDGTVRRDRLEPLIFHAWMRELAIGLLTGVLGDEGREMLRELPALLRAAVEGRSAWCGGAVTACHAVAAAALTRALDDLGRRFGPDMTQWRWGDAHVARFANPLYQRVPVLRDWFGFRVPTDGDYYTVNRGATPIGSGGNPFEHVHGAGYRAVYDLADLNRSVFIVTPGQSGHPLSSHWGDLAQDWAEGRHFPLIGTRDALATGGRVLRLVPGGR